jgi:AcrR family transcriptional regulator
MADRPYHHGDLRAALLAQAEDTLRVSGVGGLSLRELARAVGVSHGAPRRHFDDKAALLEALATEGFHRLGRILATTAEPDHRDFVAVLKDVAVAYVRFATENPALIELMAGNRYLADAPDALIVAREATFAPVRKLVETGQASGEVAAGSVRQIGTIIFATVHGLATMANNKMINPLDDQLVSDAIHTLMTGYAPSPAVRG